MMDFNQISRTHQRVRAKQWTVRRSPQRSLRSAFQYFAPAGWKGLAHAVHCPINSDQIDRVRINLLSLIIGPYAIASLAYVTGDSLPLLTSWIKPLTSMLSGISGEALMIATSSRTDCSRSLNGRKSILSAFAPSSCRNFVRRSALLKV